MNEKTLALMYLAEQTSPDGYEIKNLDIKEKFGCIYARFLAVLHSFDVMNRNRRMYDGNNVWECIQTNERIQDGIRKKTWFGEEDHPGQDFINMQLTAERVQKIKMDNASHIIIKPYRDKNLLLSEIETYSGSNVGIGMCRAVVQGCIPSFSCRSIAFMQYKNGKPYVTVRKVITYDWVIYPSHREAEMIDKPTISTGARQILLESASDPSNFETKKYSKDVCIPFNEFVDFRNYVSENDDNTYTILESAGYTVDDITGIDPVTNNLIIESDGNKLFVNTSINTKKRVEDFLSSFDF